MSDHDKAPILGPVQQQQHLDGDHRQRLVVADGHSQSSSLQQQAQEPVPTVPTVQPEQPAPRACGCEAAVHALPLDLTVDAHDANCPSCWPRDPGLGAPAIIPPPGLAAPHPIQPPATASASIKPASPGSSRAPPGGDPAPSPTMIFSDLYKSPRSTLSKLRNPFPHGLPPPLSDLDADLVSRDKGKQKEAVKKFLAEKIRNDWEFTWPPAVASTPAPAAEEPTPPVLEGDENGDGEGAAAESPSTPEEDVARDPGEEADSESDAESVYSTISEDPLRFRPRAEWTSDLSDDDNMHVPTSPFRFDSPDAVGAAVHDSSDAKRTRRRRAVRDEAKWNPGLACFEARRNAWTGAKTVRVKPKPRSPVSPSSPRRLFWRHHRTRSSVSNGDAAAPTTPLSPTSPLHATTTRTSTTTATSESDSARSTTGAQQQRDNSQDGPAPPPPAPTPAILYPVHTVLPVPPPLLPPQNPMRASVQPSMYGSLYDKVVVQSLQPSCPVNLADMLRACVVGWKRDGEWPPKPTYALPPAVVTPPPDVIAARQRQRREREKQMKLREKEQQRMVREQELKKREQEHKRKGSTAGVVGESAQQQPQTPGSSSRRMSFVGFFHGGGGGGGGNKTQTQAQTQTQTQEAREKDHHHHGGGGGGDNNTKEAAGQQSHSDEAAASSGGKALFRRSLQRVLSLGQHGSHESSGPVSPVNKDATAAG